MRLQLGSPATCSDGRFGELVDIVVDPTTRTVTHIVVEPHHRHWMARLVPIGLVSGAAGAGGGDDGELALACTIDQARRLDDVQQSAFLPLGTELEVDDPDWDVGVDGVLVLPYYGHDAPPRDALETALYDRIPKGEIEIRRSSTVTSVDDQALGHVEGFVVDGDEQITHVLLQRGHLWGKREVTIPVADVARVQSDAITLRLTKDEVSRLEPVPIHRWH